MANQESRNQHYAIFMDNIAWLREQSGLSKKTMAELLHIGVNTLTKIEQGEMPPNLSSGVLVQIQNVFDIPPSVQLSYRLRK